MGKTDNKSKRMTYACTPMGRDRSEISEKSLERRVSWKMVNSNKLNNTPKIVDKKKANK